MSGHQTRPHNRGKEWEKKQEKAKGPMQGDDELCKGNPIFTSSSHSPHCALIFRQLKQPS